MRHPFVAEHVAQPRGHGLAVEELPTKETYRKCASVKEVHAITYKISAGGQMQWRFILSGYYQEKQVLERWKSQVMLGYLRLTGRLFV